jgi:hypothetical protein
MNQHTDLDRILETWFDDGPTVMPDRVVAVVADRIGRQAQRRAWRLDRRPNVNVFLKVAVAAAISIALIGGAVLLVGGRLTGPTPVPLPSASPEAASAAPATAALIGPLPESTRAKWLANASSLPSLQNGGGPVSLVVNTAGTGLSTDNFAPGASFGSTVGAIADDQIRVTLDRDSGGCPAGAVGTYRWALSPDGSQLQVFTLDDDCVSRSEALTRTWARSLTGASTSMGAGVVDTMDPDFAVTLPDDNYEARTLPDFVEIGGSNGFSLIVMKNPQGFADACSDLQERYPYTPGAEAFVEYFRQNDAFTVIESTPLRVDDKSAIHLVVEGKPDYAPCPGKELMEYTPQACDCHFILGQGGRDSLFLVDVGTDTFMFVVSPVQETALETPVIESIRIPVDLPSQ